MKTCVRLTRINCGAAGADGVGDQWVVVDVTGGTDTFGRRRSDELMSAWCDQCTYGAVGVDVRSSVSSHLGVDKPTQSVRWVYVHKYPAHGRALDGRHMARIDALVTGSDSQGDVGQSVVAR